MNANGLIFTSLGWQTSLERSPGAYRIAHYLRQTMGIDVEVIDRLPAWRSNLLVELIDSRISQNQIKWIGFSITWLSRYETYKSIISFIRLKYPELKIILGGQDIYYKDLDADYYINGYGELAVVEALNHAFSNGKIKGIPLKNGWLINAIHMYPAYPPETVGGSYSIEYEDRDFILPSDVLTIELERGCKFKCKYCSYPILGVKGDTSRTEEDMYRELQSNYDKWGVTNYAIADETINSNEEKLIKFSSAVKRLSFKPNFTGFVRLDLLYNNIRDRELLLESRIWGQYYGVETFNHESGKLIGKGLHPDKNKQTALEMREMFNKELGLYVSTMSMITGLPRESYESLDNTVKWFKENWMDQHWVFYPLTIHKKISEQDGAIKLSAMGEDLSKYGYKEIPAELDMEDFKHNGAYPYSVNWENEYGNKDKAVAWSSANTGDNQNAYLDSWDVWGVASYSGLDIQTIRNSAFTRQHADDLVYKIAPFENQYIKKKLALY